MAPDGALEFISAFVDVVVCPEPGVFECRNPRQCPISWARTASNTLPPSPVSITMSQSTELKLVSDPFAFVPLLTTMKALPTTAPARSPEFG